MSESASNVEVLPIAGRIGAEIRGVRLSADLSPGVTARIREAWLKHKVVFFRGQQHLDEASQETLGGVERAIGGAVKSARDTSRAATDLAHNAVSGIAGQPTASA